LKRKEKQRKGNKDKCSTKLISEANCKKRFFKNNTLIMDQRFYPEESPTEL
jgi:hypothetical protein